MPMVVGNHVTWKNQPFVTPEMFGAKGDGTTPDHIAIQEAITYASANSITNVVLKSKEYAVNGLITVPWGISILGLSQRTKINVLHSNDSAFLLQGRHSIRNLNINYPNQDMTGVAIIQYPATFKGVIGYSEFENISLGNAFIGFDFEGNGGLIFRDITGYPLSIGINISKSVDVVQIERVHFNPNFFGSPSTKLKTYVLENAYAIKYGRVDFGTISKAFTYGYRGLFWFTSSSSGGSTNNIIVRDWICDGCLTLGRIDYHQGFNVESGVGTFFNPYKSAQSTEGIPNTNLPNYFLDIKGGGGNHSEFEKTVIFSKNRIYRADMHGIRTNQPTIITDNIINFAYSQLVGDTAVIDAINLTATATNCIITGNQLDGGNRAVARGIALVDSVGNIVNNNEIKNVSVSFFLSSVARNENEINGLRHTTLSKLSTTTNNNDEFRNGRWFEIDTKKQVVWDGSYWVESNGYPMWLPNKTYSDGMIIVAGQRFYRVVGNGTTSTALPTHTTGTVADGGIQLTWLKTMHV